MCDTRGPVRGGTSKNERKESIFECYKNQTEIMYWTKHMKLKRDTMLPHSFESIFLSSKEAVCPIYMKISQENNN